MSATKPPTCARNATPPPPDSGAVAAFTQSIQGLSLDNFYQVSYDGLLTRSPESVVWQTLESRFPLNGVELDNLTPTQRSELRTRARVAVRDSVIPGYQVLLATLQQSFSRVAADGGPSQLPIPCRRSRI